MAVRDIVALRSTGTKRKTHKPAKLMGRVTFGPEAGITQFLFGRLDTLTRMKQMDMSVSWHLSK